MASTPSTTTRKKWQRVAVAAATTARKAATRAARQADRLYKLARAKAFTAARRRKIKVALAATGRVLRVAGRAAAVAAVAAGVSAGRAELKKGMKRVARNAMAPGNPRRTARTRRTASSAAQ